jgi:hypothetical protein
MKMKLKNWKTTLGGIISAVGLAMTTIADPVINTAGTIVAAIGTLLVGGAAADGKPRT